jgi:transposase
VTGANANDGCQAGALLGALVVRPPEPERPAAGPDERSAPGVQADGAYQNGPTRGRVGAAGFRLRPRRKGQKGVGRIRQSVERCHNFFAQFGRVARRFDRRAGTYLGWVQLAACVIFIRSGFVR